MAKRIKVTITRNPNGFQVRWVGGLVTVRSQKHADALQANVQAGMTPADAIYTAIVPPRRKLPRDPGKFAKLGGLARSASMTPEQRREIAKLAAAARWGKKVEAAPVAVEEVQ